jgi:hypothetical protein
LGNFFSASATQFKTMFDLRLNAVTHSRSRNDIGASAELLLTLIVMRLREIVPQNATIIDACFVLLPGCSAFIMRYWGKVVEANRAPEYSSGMSPS